MTSLGTSASLYRGLHERRSRALRTAATCSTLRSRRLHRLAPLPRGLRLDLRAPRRATPGSSRPAAAPMSAPPSSVAYPLRRSTAASSRGRAFGATCRGLGRGGQLRSLDEVGELVITEPMPSMPLFLWGDFDGSRYRASYFERLPGVWRHGDWIEITSSGTAIIYGRSDSTINRQGVRMGTSEIYRAVAGHRGRSPTPSSSTCPSPVPRAGCLCSWCSPTARRSTTSSPARSSAVSASSAPPGTYRLAACSGGVPVRMRLTGTSSTLPDSVRGTSAIS